MMGEKFHFSGRAGRVSMLPCGPSLTGQRAADLWRYEVDDFAISVAGEHARTIAAWHPPGGRSDSRLVLAAGSLYIGSDGEYGESTSVEPLAIELAPGLIARCFELYGTRAFALFDGDFSLVIYDSKSKSTFLVVDKLGCSDIYLRWKGDSVLFSSEPGALIDNDGPFDPVAVAFLVAHEGFVPAPFTLSNDVKAVGRSRFARISTPEGKLRCDIESYWTPDARWELPSTVASRDKFLALLNDAVRVRMGRSSSILLSGGIDSSLVLNLAVPQRKGDLLALTGSVKGWHQGEKEIAHARSIARDFGVPHESVILDPKDERLPEESFRCSTSWMNGVRLTLPLWRRFALCLRERLGEGYNVLAGQTADTLADNNYTLPSAGYAVRRALFSSWFLQIMPLLRTLSPKTCGSFGKAVFTCASSLAGPRMAGMLRSVLEGLSGLEVFYAGRIFGYGEMPGVSKAYFPMLTSLGFDRTVEWYSSHFVRPLVQSIDSRNFYRQMIQLSMDMNMLHLDSRLLFHIYRQEGGRAQLPFMDARVVTFFGCLPYPVRAVYREPKHIIRCQLRKDGMWYQPKPHENDNSQSDKTQEELLLEGSLGKYYAELLREPTVPSRSPGLFEHLDQRYFERQIATFLRGEAGVDHRFISKVGTLEVWSRALASRTKEEQALSAAQGR